jgi:hypothetical protein
MKVLKFHWKHYVANVELHTDSFEHTQDLRSCRTSNAMGCSLMQRVRQPLASEWKVNIIYVYQETNKCADITANIISEGNINIALLKSPPTKVAQGSSSL